MQYLTVFLTILFVSGSMFLCTIYAEVPADTAAPTPKIVVDKGSVQGKAGDSAQRPQSKTNKAPKKKKVEDFYFSDYPKTFVIPKGVCETKEPVMTIEK